MRYNEVQCITHWFDNYTVCSFLVIVILYHSSSDNTNSIMFIWVGCNAPSTVAPQECSKLSKLSKHSYQYSTICPCTDTDLPVSKFPPLANWLRPDSQCIVDCHCPEIDGDIGFYNQRNYHKEADLYTIIKS